MKCLYVFGGYNGYKKASFVRCFKYDTQTSKWSLIADMNSYRQLPGCTVYEGKIVVTGGCHNNVGLKLVESYDHHENKWTDLPSMIDGRYKHGAVSLGNKMFVVGGWKTFTCEVFDSSSRKFTSITQLLPVNNLIYDYASVVSIGYKVLYFYSTTDTATNKYQLYDVLKDQWCLKANDFIEANRKISCCKIPLV